jgi:hypothetical protein
MPATAPLDADVFRQISAGAALCTAARMVWDAEDLSHWRRERRGWVKGTLDLLEEMEDDGDELVRQFRRATNLPRSSGDPFKDLAAEQERVREGLALLTTVPH